MKSILLALTVVLIGSTAIGQDKPASILNDSKGKKASFKKLLKDAKESKLVLFGENYTSIQSLSFAQEEPAYEPYLDQSFLIIASSTNYDDAQTIAFEAKEKLGLDFPTSSFYPDEKEGFRTDEVCGCGEIHEYFPRGSYDDGNYVSIEYSTAYEGFTEGYYIVIVASGPKMTVQIELPKVQKYYEHAYIKNSEIYVGCMH